MICHFWCFNYGFEFQDSACNGCHDLTISGINISNVTIITVRNVNYCCIIDSITKSEAINLLKNSVLEDPGYILKKYCLIQSIFFVYIFCLVCIKWLIIWTFISL